MGCGCGKKSKINPKKRIDKKRKNLLKISKKRAIIIDSMSKEKFASAKTSRLSICNSCPYSRKIKDRKKRKIKICNKTKLKLDTIASDPIFKCPIRKFGRVK